MEFYLFARHVSTYNVTVLGITCLSPDIPICITKSNKLHQNYYIPLLLYIDISVSVANRFLVYGSSIMPAKRLYKIKQFLEVLSLKSMSTGIIARKIKCAQSTALRYLRELKAAKQVIEKRISNTINLWKLTSKRILLVDVDSTIPNLALMKISTWYKVKGDNVRLLKLKIRRRKDGSLKEGVKVDLTDAPDKIYASIAFKKNKYVLDDVAQQYPDIDIGGSGYDLHKELPPEIEAMKPDYSLYPTNDESIGFSSRGCFRNCHFCIVPEKEGKFRRAQHPSKWYDPMFKKITFFDNNILTDKQWFMQITEWCLQQKLKMWFTQGLDIRKVDLEIAKRLFEFKSHHMLSFSWDSLKDEQAVRKGIDILKQAGFTKSQLQMHVQFYVYVDSDADYESGVYRCRELKKLSCNSFVMFNIDNEQTSRIKELKWWSKGKVYFWLFDIADFVRQKCIAKNGAKAVKPL
jgi:hypothetical protein